jgi:non-ribosomal peptide synthase protein (TIGR01720 family)
MAELNKRITNLSPAKRAFLDQRLQGKMAGLGNQAIISRKTKQEPAPLAFRSDGEGTPLFLFHYLTPSQVLAKHLGPGRPVYGIDSAFEEKLYSWEESGRVATSVEELAQPCLAELLNAQPHGPYYLAGFCFGGVLAFEIAKRLKKRGEVVAFLGLLDSFYLPGLKPMSMPWLILNSVSDTKSDQTGDERRLVNRIAFMKEIVKSYKSETYPGGAVLFRAMAGRDPADDSANGWNGVFAEGVQLEDCRCTRRELFEEPFVFELATRLWKHLSMADARIGKADKADGKTLPVLDQDEAEAEKAFVGPRTAVEKALADIWTQVLRIERVSVYDRFFELGGDSILSLQVIAKATKAGLRLTLKQIFQYPTIADLAQVAEAAPHLRLECNMITGDVPLTPIQKWFFEHDYADPQHWNQAKMLEWRQVPDATLLEKAIQHLLVQHDALRLRFVREGMGWKQFNAGSEESVKLTLVDLAETPEPVQPAVMETCAAELQASLNLTEGPVIRAALFNFGPAKSACLLLVIHHLAVDGVSWQILLEDLQNCYQQLQRGGMVMLPVKTTSFRHWAQQLTEPAHLAAIAKETDYWLAISRAESRPLPVDWSGGANSEASARTVSVALDRAETRALLQEVPQAYNTQINDVLLSALALALASWIGHSTVRINLEGHGREELFDGTDVSRTVGWFTTIFPVNLDLRGLAGPGCVVKSVKEQLRRIPQHGIGYGMLRYLSGETVAEQLRTLPQPQVLFNYLGQFAQTASCSPWTVSLRSPGPAHSQRARRCHLLEINSWVADGCLQLDWRFSETVHRYSTIERLAQHFLEELRSLIRHCISPNAGGYTPSDFPNADLDQEKLDNLLAKLASQGTSPT